MSEYLQIFLDETEEQLDDLVETLLTLERDPESTENLNEAFRLVHSIKGAAGMMGFDAITVLTHHLENRFERLRAGLRRLDRSTMNVALGCIDFLRECNRQLRAGEPLGMAPELLEQLRQLEQQDSREPAPASPPPAATPELARSQAAEVLEGVGAETGETAEPHEGIRMHLTVSFAQGLPLADLKARLILSRLAPLGKVVRTYPAVDTLADLEELTHFGVVIDTRRSVDELREAADLDGVEAIHCEEAPVETGDDEPASDAGRDMESDTDVESDTGVGAEADVGAGPEAGPRARADLPPSEAATPSAVPIAQPAATSGSAAGAAGGPPAGMGQPAGSAGPSERERTQVAATMRVDVERLDNLMNLAGELVVNRAQFVQASQLVGPAFRKTSVMNRARELSETLRRTIDELSQASDTNHDWNARIQELETGWEFLLEQTELWESSRRSFQQIDDAVDHLTEVSDSLRRSVLGTRMVPIGPLFNRFQRVVRDLSMERGKRVNLQIRGEKTELDKSMIDALGDPLVHLVRNSIDHGLEPPDVRRGTGKPEAGTILLEANHRGNNIYIRVQDDGRGLDVEKIKSRAIERGMLAAEAADELPDEQILDFVWRPGFSTAAEVTDVSGRGVGMDVVKTRIGELNGTVEIETLARRGTTFTIRLPLTLAIVNSLLFRIADVIFCVPIDDVREIVSVKPEDIVTVGGKQAFELRDRFAPLVAIGDLFDWRTAPHDAGPRDPRESPRESSLPAGRSLEVVILQSGGRTLGLKVDELLGGQDIVIKSLAENFVHIRGLSGATVLGDGTVSLMLDVGSLIDMAVTPVRSVASREEPGADGPQ